MKTKFKHRYILGEGYPWALNNPPYKAVVLRKHIRLHLFQELVLPNELFADDLPKYHLVLEKVKP